jgi:hypothetical protein
MPYARGPYARGPYALCQIVPHVTEKGYMSSHWQIVIRLNLILI